MAIHYRHFFKPYRDVPINELKSAVEEFERVMMAYRKEGIGIREFKLANIDHSRWEDVSVKEVFSENVALREEAEDLVNRNEMAHRCAGVLEAEARRLYYQGGPFVEEACPGRLSLSREERIELHMRELYKKEELHEIVFPPLEVG